MKPSAHLFSVVVFTAIALFLISYTWVPSRDSLRLEEGQITRILPQANTWYEVEIITSSKKKLICRGRKGWPPVALNRCPLDKFFALQGQTVTLLHDTKRPYEVRYHGNRVMEYSVFQNTHRIGIVLALLMLLLVFYVWKRK